MTYNDINWVHDIGVFRVMMDYGLVSRDFHPSEIGIVSKIRRKVSAQFR